MAYTFVRNVGTTVTATGTTISLVVGASGVAVGDLVVVGFQNNSTTAATSVTDNHAATNNVWAKARTANGNGLNSEQWSCLITTALVSGDHIDANFGSSQTASIGALEFAGGSVNTVDVSNSGTAAAAGVIPPASIVAAAGDVVVFLVSTATSDTLDVDPPANYTAGNSKVTSVPSFYMDYSILVGSATRAWSASVWTGALGALGSVNVGYRLAAVVAAVIPRRVPKPLGPSSRAFHMLQHLPPPPSSVVVVAAPFVLTDWPNAWAKPNPIDTRTIADSSEFWMLQDTFFGAAGQPPANQDWPNPNRGAVPSIELRTWLQNTVRFLGLDRFFGAAGQSPANLDWPVPRGAVPNIELRTWLQSLKQNLRGQDTFFAAPGVGPDYDWPNPQRPTPAIDLRTWVQNLITNTLATIVVVFPFNLLDWPITLGKTPNPSLKTHIDPLKTNLQGQDMFFGLAGQPPTNLDWPVPKGPTPSIGLRSHFVNLLQSTLLVIVPASIKRIVYVSGRVVYKLSAWLHEDL